MQAQWKKGHTLSRSRDAPGRDGKPLDNQRGEASRDSHDNEPPRHPLKSLSSSHFPHDLFNRQWQTPH